MADTYVQWLYLSMYNGVGPNAVKAYLESELTNIYKKVARSFQNVLLKKHFFYPYQKVQPHQNQLSLS